MFSLPALILRNLAYHWRGNLAVLLGVAVGSAVLTGALLVGDSLRGSLRERAERQLGGIDHAALFLMPVRAAVADGMPGRTAPVLMLNGSLQAGIKDDGAFLARVSVLGVDSRFAPAGTEQVDWKQPRRKGEAPIALGARVAEQLNVKVGDQVRLGVPRFSDLPRSSSLAKRSILDSTSLEPFRVAAVLPPDSPGNDFNLSPSPAAPLNVFVSLGALSDLTRDEYDRSEEPFANALLSRGASLGELNDRLRKSLDIGDYGIRLRQARHDRFLCIESDQLVLPPAQEEVAMQALADLKLRGEPTIVYFGESLSQGDRELPYPAIAGLNPNAAPPLGPFLPKGVDELKDNEVVLLDWPRNPIAKLAPGSTLTLKYYHPDIEGEGRIETVPLTLRGYVPLSRTTQDRELTPLIRGVTDERADLFSWDRPPMLPKAKIKQKVPDASPRAQFWVSYKAAPMAYVNLATARKLFASRFGAVTSIRVAPNTGEDLEQTESKLDPAILKRLDPAASGLVFDPIRERLFTASKGGTDFGGLFLGFSCFLIAAALMLVGLLFRLALDRRTKEIGLLLASGYSVKQVRRILLSEGLVIALLGTGAGLAAGTLYNGLMLKVLLALWPDPEIATFLKPHASAMSFATGFATTVVMAMSALWFGLRGLVRVAPPALLRGETGLEPDTQAGVTQSQTRKRVAILIGGSVMLGVVLIVAGGSISNPDFQAMSFFGGGALLLTAGLATLSRWLKSTRHREVRSLPKLGIRNASRNPSRSLLTAALLASAAFLLVAVESFRREPGKDFSQKTGGSGGFNLIGESDVPLYELPGTPLAKYETYPLRLRTGDDASCLNLFQASRPRILGAPKSLIERGGFQFYETQAKSDEEKANPWLLLNRPDMSILVKEPRDAAVPVFCENNTAQWMLKTAVGGIITVPDDSGNDIKLKIVGTFADSPFQSELIMSDENFVRLFPKQDGYRMFLIAVPPGEENAASRELELGLRRNGFIATPTKQRVAAYQAVIGAYLSTFQLLGGFGLLLGVLGLAVVLLRGVWERLGELALLRAVGYRTRALQFLVLAENAALLLIGIAIGVLAALASVAPHVAQGASVPWARLAAMLALVIVVGLGVASAATAGILRVPVIPALRRE
ncbi:MAG: FtsX-like permease family protein [Gemmataceae bacterium]